MLTLHVGTETQAVVEFAPYQKIPGEKSKTDSRIATIEEGMLRILFSYTAVFTRMQHRRRLPLVRQVTGE